MSASLVSPDYVLMADVVYYEEVRIPLSVLLRCRVRYYLHSASLSFILRSFKSVSIVGTDHYNYTYRIAGNFRVVKVSFQWLISDFHS